MGKERFSCIDELSFQNLVAEQLGMPHTVGMKLEEPIPGSSSGHVRGLSPPRTVLHPGKKQAARCWGTSAAIPWAPCRPSAAIDTTICMGASVSGLHGFTQGAGALAPRARPWLSSATPPSCIRALPGLVNIAYNESNATVIILDNSITGMTGHQQNPTTGFNLKGDPCTKIDLESLCRSVGIRRVRVVDPYDLAAMRRGGQGRAGCR